MYLGGIVRHANKYGPYLVIGSSSSEIMPSNICKVRRFRSSCACVKYHPSLCTPVIHSVVFNDSVIGQRRPLSDCADAPAELGLRSPYARTRFRMGRPIIDISGLCFLHMTKKSPFLFCNLYLDNISKGIKRNCLQAH